MRLKKNIVIYLFFLVVTIINAQDSKFINLENETIHYKVFENTDKLKQTILIINGGPGLDSDGLEAVAKKIQTTNTVILYDQRGTGKSKLNELSKETVNMDSMLRDIESIRQDLGLDEWIIFGHSFGGMLASYYASEYPDNVKALVLSSSAGLSIKSLFSVNPSTRLNKVQQDSLLYWTTKISSGDTTYQAKYQRGKYLANAYLQNKKNINYIATRLAKVNIIINQLLIQDMILQNFDCSEKLKQFKKPVLIIHGKDDIISTDVPKTIHEVLTNSELNLIDNCAHYGWLDQPEAYYKSVLDFFKAINNQP
ncbi:alpha/beta fold hydrolase [uncultured Psychroserpens sp.]|uniref:alpha/beta fold hydrolase n=1 Tax=uncultured Psychroserpens sp. TaxID=255436 RepID=UPI002627D75A|nr:alpha/beta fold hydrolase [uncultured Psychroserpens sp.]